MRSGKHIKRTPGRPSGADGNAIRTRLLDAARETFARHGFRGTTIRMVAESAGTSPATIHYHFEDKHGLYRAMLQATVGPFLQRLQSIADGGASDSLHAALHSYMQLIAGTPDLPTLLMRDVLSTEGAMRETFVRDFASRGARAMQHILERDRQAGRLREDLDPRLALLSLLSMAVFPFIARPVASEVLGITYDDETVKRMAAHTVELFYEGALQRGRKS